MKKFLVFASCCILTAGLASCDKNNDMENTPPGSQTGQPDTQFQVTSIKSYHNYNSVFNYDHGKMVSGLTNDEDSFTITRDPLKVNVKYTNSSSGEFETHDLTDIQTNTEGYITSANFLDCYYSNYSEPITYNGTYTFKYDSEGHLTEQKNTYNTTHSRTNTTVVYTWFNGNLLQIHVLEEEYEGNIPETTTKTYTYTYGDASKHPNTGIFLESMYDFTYDFMWYAGLLGKPSRNIPTGYTYTYSKVGSVPEYKEEQKTIRVNYNADGSIASIRYTDPDGESYIDYYGYNGKAIK